MGFTIISTTYNRVRRRWCPSRRPGRPRPSEAAGLRLLRVLGLTAVVIIHMCVSMCLYVYIYIYRERERQREIIHYVYLLASETASDRERLSGGCPLVP